MKWVGHAIILKLEPQSNLSMPDKTVLRNAIKDIPYRGLYFRLEFLRICELFPFDSVNTDIKNSVDA